MRLSRLLTYATISLVYVGIAFPVLADTRSEVIKALPGQTNVPIEFPKILPDSGGDPIYWQASGNTEGYEVSIELTPDCGGATACTMGYFSASRNAQIEPYDSSNDDYEHIKLNNGYSAIFINNCGAYCTASVEWKIQGVLYRISLKNGTKEEVIRTANSVYN